MARKKKGRGINSTKKMETTKKMIAAGSMLHGAAQMIGQLAELIKPFIGG